MFSINTAQLQYLNFQDAWVFLCATHYTFSLWTCLWHIFDGRSAMHWQWGIHPWLPSSNSWRWRLSRWWGSWSHLLELSKPDSRELHGRVQSQRHCRCHGRQLQQSWRARVCLLWAFCWHMLLLLPWQLVLRKHWGGKVQIFFFIFYSFRGVVRMKPLGGVTSSEEGSSWSLRLRQTKHPQRLLLIKHPLISTRKQHSPCVHLRICWSPMNWVHDGPVHDFPHLNWYVVSKGLHPFDCHGHFGFILKKYPPTS